MTTDAKCSSDAEITARIDSLHADISSAQRELLRYIAEWDRRGRWRNDGCRDMAAWVAARFGISHWAAARWVHAAHALEQLPLVSTGLCGGRLSLDKVLELARIATPETEKKLIAWARRVSAAAIRRKADRARARPPEDITDADGARYLKWWWFDDGARMGLEGEFPAAEGAVIAKALTRIADKVPALPPDAEAAVDPDDLVDVRRADALYAMASTTIAVDADPDRATIVVHTTVDECCPGAELEGGPVIDPATERRLSCDARVQRVEWDGRGRVVGIGRTARDVPPWLLRVLRARDHGCTFPGCGLKRFVHAHHIDHWEDGGPTDVDNLVLVCPYHHKLVHEYGWRVALRGAAAEWFRPDGARYVLGPDPPRERSASRAA